MLRLKLLVFFVFAVSVLFAQDRGSATYQFLDMPISARVTALGGNLITVKDNDPTLGADNPALLNPTMDQQLALSYMNYFAGTHYGYSSYAKHLEGIGTFNAGVRYFSYGTFTETDERGNVLGEFSAGDYALTMGWGRAIDSSFSVGADFKVIYSALYAGYSALALAVDIASAYTIEEKKITMSLVVKNIGREVVSYSKGERSAIPFEVQAGVAKQLANMPIRFSLIAHHLNRPDIRYDSPLSDETQDALQFGEEEDEKKENTFAGNVFQHFIMNAEFIPTKNFNVRLGYNFNRRKEMRIDAKPGTVGFSWGLGFRISKFHISYARSAYHLAGSPNHFTVVTNIADFTRK
jgi:hypothetical protein